MKSFSNAEAQALAEKLSKDLSAAQTLRLALHLLDCVCWATMSKALAERSYAMYDASMREIQKNGNALKKHTEMPQ